MEMLGDDSKSEATIASYGCVCRTGFVTIGSLLTLRKQVSDRDPRCTGLTTDLFTPGSPRGLDDRTDIKSQFVITRTANHHAAGICQICFHFYFSIHVNCAHT